MMNNIITNVFPIPIKINIITISHNIKKVHNIY